MLALACWNPGYDKVLVVASEIYSRILNWKTEPPAFYSVTERGLAVLGEVEDGKGIWALG